MLSISSRIAVNNISFRPGFNDQTLVWALVLSIGLHIFVLVWLPSFKIDVVKVPEILDVELVPIKAPEPLPEVIPEPKPEPEPPKPKVMPKPIPKPEPKPIPKHEPPVFEPPPSDISVEPVTAPPPAVIAVAPEAESLPTLTAPPPEPPAPSNDDLEAARNRYKDQLVREMLKHKQYPKIAKIRGWQGEVKIDVLLDSNGNVLSSNISVSSGHDVLDKQALEMVKNSTFPAPPKDSFHYLIPVPFRLVNS